MIHELATPTVDLLVLPGVLVARTCDVLFKYASDSSPCGCPVVRSSNSRSLRSAQSRKRVPSFTVSQPQCMNHPG
jgi:hypothetical protein